MRAFAKKIGITGEAVRLLENGTSKPTERTIRDICEKCNVNREWLVNGTGSKKPEQSPVRSLDAMASTNNIDSLTRAIIEGLITMKPEHREAFIGLIHDVADRMRRAEYDQVTAETVAATAYSVFNSARGQNLPAEDPEDSSELHTV